MSNSLDIKEVVSQVKKAPVQLEDVSRATFLDQELVAQNTKAIQALEDEDTRPGVLDIYAHEFQLDVYKKHLDKVRVLGQPYVQWFVEKMLCAKYNVAFAAPRPDRLAPPADLAYTTMWIKWDEGRVKAARASIMANRGRGRGSYPVYEPPTTPLPGPSTKAKEKQAVVPKAAPPPAPTPTPTPSRAPKAEASASSKVAPLATPYGISSSIWANPIPKPTVASVAESVVEPAVAPAADPVVVPELVSSMTQLTMASPLAVDAPGIAASTTVPAPEALEVEEEAVQVASDFMSETDMVQFFADNGVDLMSVWKMRYPNAGDPVLKTPGMPACGPFAVPFPLERDWKGCFMQGNQKLAQVTGNGIMIAYQKHGEGKKVVLSLMRDKADPTMPIIQLGLLNAWADLCAWHKELLQGKDANIVDVFNRQIHKRICAEGGAIAAKK